MSRFFSLIFILFFSCSTKEYPNIIIAEIPKNQMEFQKMIIGQLTGEISINTEKNDSISINSRWSAAEKTLSREYLKQIIEKIGLEPETHNYSIPNTNFGVDLLIEPLNGNNLYTTLPSTSESNEYVIMGAHYDTGGKNVPGAIDNGSGIALILSAIRKMAELKFRSKNVMVVFFDQEEEGVSAGSIAFADYLNKTDLKIHSVHSFDLIGWDSDNNKEIELELPSKDIERMYKKHAALLNIPIYTTNTNSSDHYSFIKAGINAVGISQAYGKGDNSGKKDSPEDRYHLVNFEYLESATKLAYEVIKDIIDD
nr:M28 family peptidase [uncultured Psychroserpens sp.]